jgi:hypothetical protein
MSYQAGGVLIIQPILMMHVNLTVALIGWGLTGWVGVRYADSWFGPINFALSFGLATLLGSLATLRISMAFNKHFRVTGVLLHDMLRHDVDMLEPAVVPPKPPEPKKKWLATVLSRRAPHTTNANANASVAAVAPAPAPTQGPTVSTDAANATANPLVVRTATASPYGGGAV